MLGGLSPYNNSKIVLNTFLLKGGMPMCKYLPDFVINLIAGIVGILIVLWIERQCRPRLFFKIGVPGTIDDKDVMKRHPTTFLKVQVHNRNLPRWLSWVYMGEPALSCSGWVSFFDEDGAPIFPKEMLGRWSETPDPPPIDYTKVDDVVVARLVSPQNTVDIPPGEYSNLDIVNKIEGEEQCYGWNNESYIHKWRHPEWSLAPGKYLAKVRVKTGGLEFKDVFVIRNDLEFNEFRLEEASDELKEKVL